MGHDSARAALIYLHSSVERQRVLVKEIGRNAKAALSKPKRPGHTSWSAIVPARRPGGCSTLARAPTAPACTRSCCKRAARPTSSLTWTERCSLTCGTIWCFRGRSGQRGLRSSRRPAGWRRRCGARAREMGRHAGPDGLPAQGDQAVLQPAREQRISAGRRSGPACETISTRGGALCQPRLARSTSGHLGGMIRCPPHPYD